MRACAVCKNTGGWNAARHRRLNGNYAPYTAEATYLVTFLAHEAVPHRRCPPGPGAPENAGVISGERQRSA